MAEIIDGVVVVREPSKERVVYFVQAQELRLIKIGVCDRPERRLRELANGCPDELTVLGLQYCDDFGRLEEDLHAKFAEDRVRGEWFLPSDRLRRHIQAHARKDRAAIERLDAMVKFPTMRKGRPTKAMMREMGLAGFAKCP
ncbi:hypothetical protein GGQ61_000167 [Phenylobacterium haematophilum]|uniref:Bacteriophage T5 Orf172 DNA-binding domain-containing protein n=1 Tax=Phenylobacterium haematophilum TaxID=98513 RepID=A0A839ZW00_9CAUL|nr:hypothetical protein [Phenylobacterium haematophilum]